MLEETCPICGGNFYGAQASFGPYEDGFRNAYCSDECRDRGEEVRSRWHRDTPTKGVDKVNWGGRTITASLAWDILDGLDDPFA